MPQQVRDSISICIQGALALLLLGVIALLLWVMIDVVDWEWLTRSRGSGGSGDTLNPGQYLPVQPNMPAARP
ncbi:hypothetical protein SAMN06272781_4110 [Streptomyces sp. 1222.2]|uniref:hypothetical protein n=1 Tax=Streptomyces sp. 1222.2 TaxID=1938833 RepID=UPI000BD6032E|nr:hypothetical protein [Streptomyces sp. 1222.2]SOD76283.1 hypothetical protein SAMN06272781_4110 [Streptomyces sp. 1222.2]